MTASRAGGHSRPGSSRATSVAREIMKRREKPYKTEKQRILTKKRKLELHTSYRNAPAGYTFVAVGTPELSDRCKELSRQRGLAVSVVNAQPVSKHAHDPEKVSHHIHRIGYHFRTEVVEQAREELGYVYYRDHFIKEADLQTQYQQSHIARIMAQHGIRTTQPAVQETPAQVRAAIKELFPRIPDDDLDQIVEHAWKEGSHRVGTNAMLELPRRVQLATIARIRHTYTDYDRLLRAFEWKEARSIVEQECLKKLIEWRGENDEEDDNELEEIVRETIVIDDDNDEPNTAQYDSSADDENSDAELGDTSDASIEFTHHLVADEDFGAESVDERSRNFLQRYQPRSLRTDQQNSIAREKIGAVRQQLRHVPQTQPTEIKPVKVVQDERGLPPSAIVVDGTVYHLAPAQAEPRPPQTPLPARQPHQYGAYGSQYPPQVPTSDPRGYGASLRPSTNERQFDHVLPSVEPHMPISSHESYAGHRGKDPETPKRRRIEYSPNNLRPLTNDGHRQAHQAPSNATQPGHRFLQEHEVIDLTSPDRRNRSGNPSPMRDVQTMPMEYVDRERHFSNQHAFGGRTLHEKPSVMPDAHSRLPSNRHRHSDVEPERYDPRQPMMQLPEREPYRERYAVPTQPGQNASTLTTQPIANHAAYYSNAYAPFQNQQQSHTHIPYQQNTYQEPQPQPQLRFMQVPPAVPQPVHGAPAPVQQLPRDGSNAVTPAGQSTQNYQDPSYAQYAPPPAQQPVNGAPHPAQYYYSR